MKCGIVFFLCLALSSEGSKLITEGDMIEFYPQLSAVGFISSEFLTELTQAWTLIDPESTKSWNNSFIPHLSETHTRTLLFLLTQHNKTQHKLYFNFISKTKLQQIPFICVQFKPLLRFFAPKRFALPRVNIVLFLYWSKNNWTTSLYFNLN